MGQKATNVHAFCYACSPNNPVGLKLDFQRRNEEVEAIFIPNPEHEVMPGTVHGGIICTLVDEAMAQLLLLKGMVPLTVKLRVRFLKATSAGQPLIIRASVAKQRSRGAQMQAQIILKDGTPVAEADATFVDRNKMVMNKTELTKKQMNDS